MVIIETSVFTRQVQQHLDPEDYRKLQAVLTVRPDLGTVIPGSGGLRKARWGYQAIGKRGGLRVIYYWAVEQNQLLMLFLYPKNVRGDLSPSQLAQLRRIIESEYP